MKSPLRDSKAVEFELLIGDKGGMKWMVTGGAGFIGSAFVRMALSLEWADEVLVLDALTYAGNLENLESVREHSGFEFRRGDVASPDDVKEALVGVDVVFHFAAESHVDRSIHSASEFVRTNVMGTQVLLDGARAEGVQRFVHVSTDEVYGALELETGDLFYETTPLDPTSPYSASKASSDLLVLAAVRTHGFDAVITRCTNNYGPYQFPEKFIPLFISNALRAQKLPIYGDGKNIRDWIHVDDHVRGIYQAYTLGRSGEVYNLGGECERANSEVAAAILEATGQDEGLLEFVKDRPAHDRRYAMNIDKARRELKFEPGPPIEERLLELVTWYRDNQPWWERIKAGEYRHYFERMYGMAVRS